MTRNELMDLWLWALIEGSDRPSVPDKIHQREWPAGDFDGEAKMRAKPFTRRFTAYVDRRMPRTEIRVALGKLKPRRSQPLPLEYRICHLIVDGGYGSPEEVAQVLRCHLSTVEACGLRGLQALKGLTEELKDAEGKTPKELVDLRVSRPKFAIDARVLAVTVGTTRIGPVL